MAIGTSRMHSHLFYTFPFRSFSWAIPLLAQVTPLAREVLSLVDVCIALSVMLMIVHFVVIGKEFWGMPDYYLTAMCHGLCYHVFATIVFPLLLFFLYDRDFDHLPDRHIRIWNIIILLLTIFLDNQTKLLCDMIFGTPPEFDDGTMIMYFDKMVPVWPKKLTF